MSTFVQLDVDSITQLQGLLLLAITKFAFALIGSLMLEAPIEAKVITLMIGGEIGVLLSTYFGTFFKWLFIKIRYRGQKPKIFNKTNRLLILLKNKFGIIGISALSPILISIPVGVAMSLSLTNQKWKIILFMTLSIMFWIILIYGLFIMLGYQ